MRRRFGGRGLRRGCEGKMGRGVHFKGGALDILIVMICNTCGPSCSLVLCYENANLGDVF